MASGRCRNCRIKDSRGILPPHSYPFHRGWNRKRLRRSIPSFDLCSGLAECKEFLLSFGGHRQAAGIRLKVENIPLFERAMQRIAETALSKEDLVPSLEIDADVALSEVNHSLIREIAMLEPVGCSNEEPFLQPENLRLSIKDNRQQSPENETKTRRAFSGCNRV